MIKVIGSTILLHDRGSIMTSLLIPTFLVAVDKHDQSIGSDQSIILKSSSFWLKSRAHNFCFRTQSSFKT